MSSNCQLPYDGGAGGPCHDDFMISHAADIVMWRMSWYCQLPDEFVGADEGGAVSPRLSQHVLLSKEPLDILQPDTIG